MFPGLATCTFPIESSKARPELRSSVSELGIDDGKSLRLACAPVGMIHFQKEDL